MKYLIIWFSILLSTRAFSEFSTEMDDSKSISDLMYLPEEGRYFTILSFSKGSDEHVLTYTNAGENLYTSDIDSMDSRLEVGGVISGGMLLSIDIPYQFESEDSTKYGAASTLNGQTLKTNSKGLGDLGLNFKWRIIEQSKMGVNLDITGNISPKTGDNDTASTTIDGNNFRGGTTYGIGAELGRKLKSVQLSGEIDIKRNGTRELKSPTSTTDVSSFTEFSVGASVQLQPNDKFFLNAGISYFSIEDYSTKESGTTTTYDLDPYFQLAVAIGYKLSSSVATRLIYTSASIERSLKQGANRFEEEIETQAYGAILQVEF